MREQHRLMGMFRFWISLGFLLFLSGCDLYLPGCGSGTALDLLRGQALKPYGLEVLAEIGMVTEISSDLKKRERVCTATIEPRSDFAQRYNEARQKIGGGQEDNVLGMIGRALISAALPDRLEKATIRYQMLRDERSQGFGLILEDDSQDDLATLSKGYQLADIAISRILPKAHSGGDLAAPSSDH